MPVNLDALIRYHTIDKCLQNFYREWTWEDLAKACFDALDEVRYRSDKNTVSKRTIENDIKVLRSNILGYNAPIVCRKGLYSYSDRNYSIKNASLTQKDIRNIALAIETLKQYKGFHFFDNLKNSFESLEHRVAIQLHKNLNKFIHFEDTYLPTGTNYINNILDAIQNQQVLKITYQKFDSEVIKKNTLHPYLLKEFKNRWYVLGFNPNFDFLKTYALDRIKEIEILKTEIYQANNINAQSFFSNVIGVSNPTDTIQEVKIIVKPIFSNYIKTQPLHHSQVIIKEDERGLHIKLQVVHNVELETLICGYANFLVIQHPESLKKAIKKRLIYALENF
ncbi:helix-turn-helix transcriptional regulator [Pedobacter puniceum]|uniref:WYL domain-containing protein n=1 Tax=Pedobacter puniceum TaxID=2666136 RepID=A0A7K0FIN1_9SPHI|nr:WYL domain-containing protein [Pedobacter puniceum]MRX45834.1 WYL domain-containing protein [Pedobacter puniceum]